LAFVWDITVKTESKLERSGNFGIKTVSCRARHKYSHGNYQQLALKSKRGKGDFRAETIACEERVQIGGIPP